MEKSSFSFETAYRHVDIAALRSIVKGEFTNTGVPFDLAAPVFDYACSDQSRFPNLRQKNWEAYGIRWASRFIKAFEARCSTGTRAEPSTVSEPVLDVFVDQLIESEGQASNSHQNLRPDVLQVMQLMHRYAMGVENVVGSLLEEYIDSVASKVGWYFCWGETLRAVDLLKPGDPVQLLQIKNRSNSENSSGSNIRSGTTISKWYRLNAKTGGLEWKELAEMLGAEVSEGHFREFVRTALKANPQLLTASSELLQIIRTLPPASPL